MELMRNKEVKITLQLFLVIGGLLAAAGAFISIACSLYVLFAVLVLWITVLISTKKRYQKIRELSKKLDQILHGDDTISLDQTEEGELSILNSELYKMTIRLRQQADNITRDKIYLNNSLADISHQLRTPLTSIRLLLPRLQKEQTTARNRMDIIQELNMLLTRVDWLISSLLKISKLESGTVTFKTDQVSLALLIEKAAEPLMIPIELREQRLITQLPPNACYQGDFLWSVEAIGNILKNCMEHTPRGGSIFVKAHENIVYTEITITDTGNGFDEYDLPHLFERFYKGKDSNNQNIGIGLALSRMIIHRQNGTITAWNQKNGGAGFTIRIYQPMVL